MKGLFSDLTRERGISLCWSKEGVKKPFFPCFKLKRAVLGFSGLKRELPPWDRQEDFLFENSPCVLSCLAEEESGAISFFRSLWASSDLTSLSHPKIPQPTNPFLLLFLFALAFPFGLLVPFPFVRERCVMGGRAKKNVSYFFGGGGFHLATKRKRRERKEIRFRSPKRSDIVQSDK